ncbi:hypothetical protein [Acetobacter sp.]|jgi:hypothetical protein|uniref:hypothetical protein n=1 Tax=Acetobacter sp. TaxID=440 RepID=UPI0025BDD5C2|nr:hypothetical protein [Acetobacter sp.]MCH4091562.1 hypothetical protein [Acetobacter sp.]
MSFLGIVSSIESAIGPQNFTLGPINFLDTEVPSELFWGGHQATEIFYQIGGAKVVILNGYYDQPLTWRGIFRGNFALQKARTLDAMARSGNSYSFSGGGISRKVVITAFQASYTTCGTIIPYEIFCEIIPQTTANTSSTLSFLSNLVNSDISSAFSTITGIISNVTYYTNYLTNTASTYAGELTPLANLIGEGGEMSILNRKLSGLSTQAGALSSLTSNLEFTDLQNNILSSINLNSSVINASDAEISSISTNSGDNLVSGSSALIAATAHSGILAASSLNNAYLKRSSSNISLSNILS